MKKPRLVIEVEAGAVTGVFLDQRLDLEVYVADYDVEALPEAERDARGYERTLLKFKPRVSAHEVAMMVNNQQKED